MITRTNIRLSKYSKVLRRSNSVSLQNSRLKTKHYFLSIYELEFLRTLQNMQITITNVRSIDFGSLSTGSFLITVSQKIEFVSVDIKLSAV